MEKHIETSTQNQAICRLPVVFGGVDINDSIGLGFIICWVIYTRKN